MAVVGSAEAGMHAIESGATVIQVRIAAGRALEREAGRLVSGSAVPVLVSARADVAAAVGAAGVNLPEGDIPVADARRLLGPGRLVGRSVHSEEAARQAAAQGADWVIFGPVFETASHPDRPAGLEALATVARAVRVPVIAIGGLDMERARRCLEAGAAGYAAIRLFEGPRR
ncbi:MAG: thiamine phosphate synthase [Candidatus Dormibacteraceae bacterium]